MATSVLEGGRYDRSVTPSQHQHQGRSPPPRWGTRGNCGHDFECVFKHVVVERLAPSGNYLILTKTNYHDWATLMSVMLQARSLWVMVSEGTRNYVDDRNT
jgi:hypothetical protein